MPDIVRLRFVGHDDTAVPILGPGPNGRGHMVSSGDVIDLPGRVLDVLPDTDPPQSVPADADYVLVEFGKPPEVRAFPLSQWAVETGKPSKKVEE
jgi:hypothetical protein